MWNTNVSKKELYFVNNKGMLAGKIHGGCIKHNQFTYFAIFFYMYISEDIRDSEAEMAFENN